MISGGEIIQMSLRSDIDIDNAYLCIKSQLDLKGVFEQSAFHEANWTFVKGIYNAPNPSKII